jgi:CheY-like chemotaxis protein
MSEGRVLIVEDNVAGEGRRLQRLLEANGIEVVGIARTIAEATEFAARGPDAVLMDIMIPPSRGAPLDFDGGIKAASEVQRRCEASIVFVTGQQASKELLEKIRRVCPTALFLTKPIFTNTEQTLATVRLALMRKQAAKRIFVSYGHGDAPIKEELLAFLKTLRGVDIDVWDDSRLLMGDRWRAEIIKALERADAGILLVSIAFMNSRFIRDLELPRLVAGQTHGRVRLVPAYISPVPITALNESGLTQFQGVNSPNDPMGRWPLRKRQEGWNRLCNQLASGQWDAI